MKTIKQTVEGSRSAHPRDKELVFAAGIAMGRQQVLEELRKLRPKQRIVEPVVQIDWSDDQTLGAGTLYGRAKENNRWHDHLDELEKHE